MKRQRRSLVPLGVTLAVLAAVATAPAQPQQPAPRAPGQAQSGPATPLPVPAVPAAPSPSVPPGSSSLPGAATAPPAAARPSPQPAGSLLHFSGQLLDVRNGYVFFTTGDAFKASSTVRIADLETGAPTRLQPGPRIYARATLDPASGSIVELDLSKRKIAADADYQQAYAKARGFVVATSATVPAPELLHGQRLTGRPVAVTFYVQVPPTTPLTDEVYITTDASGWVANAMKMDRIDALHYRLTRTYASGTKFAYRYTRGSWTSVEVGEDGLQDDPHAFFVPEVDAKRLTDVVYRWSDQNPSQPQVGPDSIPTPFNPNPFGGFPSLLRSGVPSPSPTPRP
jgi:hypothetical protein